MGKIGVKKQDVSNIRQNNLIVCSAGVALIVTIITCYLLTFLKDSLDAEWIAEKFIHTLDNFVAENSEKLQYVLGTITFVVTYFMTSLLLKDKRILANIDLKPIRDVLLIGFMLLSGDLLLKKDMYLSNIPSILLKCGFGIFVGCLIFSMANIRIIIKDRFSILNKMLFILGMVSILIVSSFYMRETFFYGAYSIEHHTNAYFYPIWKIWCGQYPLVDFSSLYGYYPYFFVGIMALFGGVTEGKFCVIIGILMAIIFICIFYVLWVICKNKFWAFAGLLSIECVLCMYNAELTGTYYLQYYPHRMLTLCLIFATCCKYIKYKQEKKCYSKGIELLGWICSGVALLWNLDTGIVVWLGWTIYLIFLYFLENSLFSRQTWLFVSKTFLKCISTAFVSFGALLVLTYLLSGQWVGFQELFFGQNMFYSSGFYMIRMTLWHPWLIVISLYALGIVISVSHMRDVIDKDKTYNIVKVAMYFMVAVIGVGAFLYYQGRSHDFVFVAIVWPAIMMIIMLVDDMTAVRKRVLRMSKLSKIVWHNAYGILVAVLLMFSIGWGYYLLSPNYLVYQKNRDFRGHSVVQSEIDIINAMGLKPDNLELLTEYSAEVYEKLGIRYMPNVQAEVDIFTWEHVKDTQEHLRKTKKDVIIDEKMKNYFIKNDEVEFNAILENKYEVEEYNGYLICRQKTERGSK